MSDDVPMEGVEDMAVDSDLEMGDFTAPTAGVPPPTPPAPQPPSQLQPGGEPTPPPPEPLETDAATAKRRAIQAIMRDLSLPDVERRRRVQTLMDGTAEATDAAQNAPGGPASTEGLLAGAVAAAAAKLEGGGGNGGGNRNMRTGDGGGGGAGAGAGLAGQVNVE